jgi:hypothetical protein
MVEHFEVQTQEQSFWCWAAVSSSVDAFFAGTRRFAQCEVAQRLSGTECCNRQNAGSPVCNRARNLDDAFANIGRDVDFVETPLSFVRVKGEIDAGRPVCARIVWRKGGAHFVAIFGYRESKRGRQFVLVSDPLFADSIVRYQTFLTDYQMIGEWAQSIVMRGKT